MATRPELVRQAERAASGRGGDQGAHHELPGARVYRLGVPDEQRYTAYYPPTRQRFPVTDLIMSITWTDDTDSQYKTGTAVIDNGDGEAARVLMRPGLIIFVETRPHGERRFREFERFIFINPQATDLQQAQISVEIADHGYYAANDGTRRTWSYHHDKDHPKGWRADQIAADVCRRMGIPVASLVKGTYHIKRFVLHQASAQDAIAKAYVIDQNKTDRHYLITYDRGRLLVKRIKRRNVLLAIDERDNARTGSFSREFPKLYASAVKPAGHRKTSDGKHHRHHAHKGKASEKEKKRQEKKAAKQESSQGARMLFGSLTFRPSLEKVGDPDYELKVAQDLADFLSRSKKTLQITCDCNMLIDRGDRIFVRFTVAKKPIRREVYVSSITKTLSSGDATMDLTCVWRAKEVDVQTDARIAPKPPKPGAGAGGGKGAIDLTGPGKVVAATIYGIGEPGTGHTGAYGDNLNTHPWSFAELGGRTRESANLLGGLPYMTAVRITNPRNGKSAVAYKRDIGYGQGNATLQGHRYAIDLWGALAHKLGITGSQLVKIQIAR